MRARLYSSVAVVVLVATAPEAAAQKKFPVEIETEPGGATVFIDDREDGPAGFTPYEGELTAGDHVLVIEMSGYETVVRDITVKRRRKPQTFTIELEEVPAVPVEITAAEDDAAQGGTILLDGEEVGTVPATVEASAGPHQIQVVKQGVPTYEEWIEVAPGESTTVFVSMGEADVDIEEEEEPEVTENDGDADALGARAMILAGASVGWRKFRYEAPRSGPLRSFDADQVGLARIDVELYPALGWADVEGLERITFVGTYAQAFPLESNTADGMEQIETVWSELELGASARFPTDSVRVDLDAVFGRTLFTFENAGELGDELPDVDYKYLRFGLGVARPVSVGELFVDGDIMAPLSTGPLADRFDGASVIGFSASAGALVNLWGDLFARIAGTWTRWGYGFDSQPGDEYDADGAGDTMYGVTFSGAYRF